MRENCLDECQRKGEVAEGLEYIGKERLDNGQGDMERTGERAGVAGSTTVLEHCPCGFVPH